MSKNQHHTSKQAVYWDQLEEKRLKEEPYGDLVDISILDTDIVTDNDFGGERDVRVLRWIARGIFL